MSRYVISDLHLGHGNIIGHCNRPFDDVEEMNEVIVDNWNSVISESDVVIFLGDLAMWGHEAAIKWADKLDGSLIFVDGNHDEIDADKVSFPVVSSCDISYGKYNFHCAHWPEKVDVEYEWLLHGHHHNNDTNTYPFIHPRQNRVNLSVELIDYTPIELSELASLLNEQTKFRNVSVARNSIV